MFLGSLVLDEINAKIETDNNFLFFSKKIDNIQVKFSYIINRLFFCDIFNIHCV